VLCFYNNSSHLQGQSLQHHGTPHSLIPIRPHFMLKSSNKPTIPRSSSSLMEVGCNVYSLTRMVCLIDEKQITLRYLLTDVTITRSTRAQGLLLARGLGVRSKGMIGWELWVRLWEQPWYCTEWRAWLRRLNFCCCQSYFVCLRYLFSAKQ
jgi:hypothetical protein